MTTNPTPTIIGLCGKDGSGKDTVRAILESQHHFEGFAFADPMRDMLEALLILSGIGPSYMTDHQLKETPIPGLGFSYRHLAQTLGTEWGRNCMGPNFWLQIAQKTMEACSDSGSVVFSDVRFANEAAWIRAQGGVIWLIDRPNPKPVRDHISEAMPFEADRIIHNHGTLEHLAVRVHEALQLVPADLAAQRCIPKDHGSTQAFQSQGIDMDAVYRKERMAGGVPLEGAA